MSPFACDSLAPSAFNRIASTRLVALALVAALTVEACAQSPAPTLSLTSLSADGTTANLTLVAPPGGYLVQASTDLAGTWTDTLLLGFDDTTGPASFTLPTFGVDRMFFRALEQPPAATVVIETAGATFAPVVECATGTQAALLWRWNDGSTSGSYPATTKTFGSPALRTHSLEVFAPTRLTKLNFGHNAADGGGITPLTLLAPQNVAAVSFPTPLPDLTCFAATHNAQLRSLDFTGCTSLEYIECFEAGGLQQVTVTDLPALRRVCFEDCNLAALDLSGLPELYDVRAALNNFSEIVVGRGTGPKIWHWCTRDNPQMTQNFADIMGDFTALEELFIWNTNQHGAFTIGSMVLRDFQAAWNHFTGVSLPGRTRLQNCQLQDNEIATIDLAGCTGLLDLNLSNNRLSSAALDALLATLVADSPNLQAVRLTGNLGAPGTTGQASVAALRARGTYVEVDRPEQNDGRIDVQGGTNAITFTTSAEQPHMEIRVSGTPTSVIWHWGDGTISEGSYVATHRFADASPHTNYVEVVPASAVTYFGAQYGQTNQGITGVTGASNFPNLAFLFLYQESVTVLDIAGCARLTQLHFADNLVSSTVCDKWFLDLDAAVAGPVTDADFFFPLGARTSASDAAYQSLVAKGYTMHPY